MYGFNILWTIKMSYVLCLMSYVLHLRLHVAPLLLGHRSVTVWKRLKTTICMCTNSRPLCPTKATSLNAHFLALRLAVSLMGTNVQSLLQVGSIGAETN
jgi:hypothetical protein